jgi:ABC-type polysaccharide/polyol phosphate transport system ATPase subunit
VTGLAVRDLWKRFRLKPSGNDVAKEHWALQGLNFNLPRGGALGVIGANGSGKSTLLQIVAGVLQPTSGSIEAPGRRVAILNPTAGFHPDLSGRANIRMLASLYGLSGRDIEGKIPAIIEFSGLEHYIDQPLRTYSAGMMIRLGFSTASHLEPDVLIVDEVLSAGDLAFQRKSQGMARKLRDEGTTLLISTHALGDLATLCDRLMLLERGAVISEGRSEDVVAAYMQRVDDAGGRIEAGAATVAGAMATRPTAEVQIRKVIVNGQENPADVHLTCDAALEIVVEYEAHAPVDDAVFRVQFFRNDGLFVHGQNTVRAGLHPGLAAGRGRATIRYERFGLLAGDYYVSLGIWPDEYRSYTTGKAYDHRPSAWVLHVDAPRSAGAGVAGFPCTWDVDGRTADDRGPRPVVAPGAAAVSG